jgi:O-acetyl-ADP-ribose deacetylase (regulator of RNase III)
VIHTVGPVWRDGKHAEPDLLGSCYRTCLQLADERKVETISFPAISTGVYNYPLAPAAEIAVREVVAGLKRPGTSIQRVIFVVFDRHASDIYAAALKKALTVKPRF